MSGTIQIWRKCTGSVFEAFLSLWVTPVPARMNWISPGRMMPPPPVESLCSSPPFEDVGEDLHVAVAVRPEAGSGRDAVVVDHAQAAEAHVPRVVVLAERERVAAVEPAPVGLAALGGRSDGDHGFLLCTLVGGLCPQRYRASALSFREEPLDAIVHRPRDSSQNLEVIVRSTAPASHSPGGWAGGRPPGASGVARAARPVPGGEREPVGVQAVAALARADRAPGPGTPPST